MLWPQDANATVTCQQSQPGAYGTTLPTPSSNILSYTEGELLAPWHALTTRCQCDSHLLTVPACRIWNNPTNTIHQYTEGELPTPWHALTTRCRCDSHLSMVSAWRIWNSSTNITQQCIFIYQRWASHTLTHFGHKMPMRQPLVDSPQPCAYGTTPPTPSTNVWEYTEGDILPSWW